MELACPGPSPGMILAAPLLPELPDLHRLRAGGGTGTLCWRLRKCQGPMQVADALGPGARRADLVAVVMAPKRLFDPSRAPILPQRPSKQARACPPKAVAGNSQFIA